MEYEARPHIVIEGLIFPVETKYEKLEFFDFLSSNAIVDGRPGKDLKFFNVHIDKGIEFRPPDARPFPECAFDRKRKYDFYDIFTVKFKLTEYYDDFSGCDYIDEETGDWYPIKFLYDRPKPMITAINKSCGELARGWQHSCILRNNDDKLSVVDWFIHAACVQRPDYIPSDKLQFLNLMCGNSRHLPDPQRAKFRWAEIKFEARRIGPEKVAEKKAKIKASVDKFLINNKLDDWISAKSEKIKRQRLG